MKEFEGRGIWGTTAFFFHVIQSKQSVLARCNTKSCPTFPERAALNCCCSSNGELYMEYNRFFSCLTGYFSQMRLIQLLNLVYCFPSSFCLLNLVQVDEMTLYLFEKKGLCSTDLVLEGIGIWSELGWWKKLCIKQLSESKVCICWHNLFPDLHVKRRDARSLQSYQTGFA